MGRIDGLRRAFGVQEQLLGRAGTRLRAAGAAVAADALALARWRCSAASILRSPPPRRRARSWPPRAAAGDGAGDVVGRPVVQQPADDGRVRAAGQKHGDLVRRRRLTARGQLDGGPGEPAVRAVDELEREVASPAGRPRRRAARRRGRVDHEVHGAQLGRAQAAGVADARSTARSTESTRTSTSARASDGRSAGGRGRQASASRRYCAQPQQRDDQERERAPHEPRALGELGDREDQHDERGDARRTMTLIDQLAAPARLPVRCGGTSPCRSRPG